MLQRQALKTSAFHGRGERVMCQYTNLEVLYLSPSSKLLRGIDGGTGSRVVLKTGCQEHMTQDEAARLRREYQIMQRIDSPHVVKALGEVTLDGALLFGGGILSGDHAEQAAETGRSGDVGFLPDRYTAGDGPAGHTQGRRHPQRCEPLQYHI